MVLEMRGAAGGSAVMAKMESKRSERRFIVNQPALLSMPGAPEQVWQARIRDISRRGMQFVLDRPFSDGPRVRVAWNGREVQGTIRYQKQQDSEYRLGVELNGSWDSLVSDILAQQADELRVANEALQRTEKELIEALEVARAASLAKSRFLASVSHELRTPLNGIIGFSQLLHDEAVGPVTDDQKDCLADVLSCSQHLLTLINHVLDLTKIEAGKMDFQYQRLSLAEHVGAAVDSMKSIAATKKLDVRLQLDPALDMVEADPARLRQVVLNYLSNAVKFTGEAGAITVDVRREGADHYRILVEDNGIGISAEDLPRLFSEFGQLGASEKAQAGTGLGLVITKRIVEAQGGIVGVESVRGKGSCFYAILPRVPPNRD